MDGSSDKNNADNRRCILAVDDSADILNAIHLILKDDYKVVLLRNPAELRDALKHATPDLFLLDYRMPEISGFDLVPVIRSFEEHKDTPIVFLTADGTINRRVTAKKLGADDFLTKPVSADELRLYVTKWIAKKK